MVAGSRTCPLGDARPDHQGARLSRRTPRPGLDSCLRALRKDDVLVVWKLDRLGRNLAHLVNTVRDMAARGGGLRGARRARARRSTPRPRVARLVFLGIFAALAEFERELLRERTVAGLDVAIGSAWRR